MPNLFSRLFRKKQDDAPMRDVAALAAPLAVPAVHLLISDAPSRSHFGGAPNLPPDVAWPERNGVRLGFLARLSLTEIHCAHPVNWLPETGALLFFYELEEQPWGFDPKDRGSWAVLVVPDFHAPLAQPDGNRNGDPVPHRNISFRRIHVLPSHERESVQALELSDAEFDAFGDVGDAVFDGKPRHQVSGYPAIVQGDDMESECQFASNGVYCGNANVQNDPRAKALEAGAAHWRLLLQFDTDDELGIMWGDCGTIYFWVEEQQARMANFANAWLTLQCH